MTEFPVAFFKRLPERFHSHLLLQEKKQQILAVIFEREQCELCSLWHFWNICNILFILKGKMKDQRQQMKLLSSCCINYSRLENRSDRKALVQCLALDPACPNTLQKDIAPRLFSMLQLWLLNGFSLDGSRSAASVQQQACDVECLR